MMTDPKQPTDDTVRILFLAANPATTAPLALDQEARNIREKLRASDHRDRFDFITQWAVRPDDLLQYLNEYRPQIVHFSGHGSQAAELLLVDAAGNPKPVSQRALAQLFKVLKDNIRVVVLNACYSERQAQAIAQHIDCIVGMNTAIGDQAAIVFAASFYRALGFGRSVQNAFDQGVAALLAEGIDEQDTPTLITRSGVDPEQVILAAPTLAASPSASAERSSAETASAADDDAAPVVDGKVRLAFCQRLGQDWINLATVLEIPSHDQQRFARGDEARAILEWLEQRERFGKLAPALIDIDRPDLAEFFTGRPR